MLLLLATLSTAHAEPDPERMLQDDRHLSEGLLSGSLHVAYWGWRNLISPGDGPRCPMRPTCSAYALESFTTHGVGGFVMTFDRLLRDGNTEGFERAPDGLHFLDPVDDHIAPGALLSGSYCRSQREDGAEACL